MPDRRRDPGREGPLDQTGCAKLLDVSRETLDPCAALLDLLGRWQTAYNLVGRSTLADPWRRHILDSAQLVRRLPTNSRVLVDLGSGAGFPGLVLALLADLEVHLIESAGTKARFLREAARVSGARVEIHHARIETVRDLRADVVTARALAPLPELLALAAPLLGEAGVCLFLKSGGLGAELTAAARDWHMIARRFDSLSDRRGKVLQIEELARATDRQPGTAEVRAYRGRREPEGRGGQNDHSDQPRDRARRLR